MAEITKEQVVEFLGNLTVVELNHLVKELEEKWGVSAAAPMAMVPMAGAGPAAAPAEEKTEFDVILETAGEKKIQVIKEVRAITGLGLKEAKDLVDGAPKAIREGIPLAEAEEVKKKLEEAGAKISIK